jgi:hypothetical protein
MNDFFAFFLGILQKKREGSPSGNSLLSKQEIVSKKVLLYIIA